MVPFGAFSLRLRLPPTAPSSRDVSTAKGCKPSRPTAPHSAPSSNPARGIAVIRSWLSARRGPAPSGIGHGPAQPINRFRRLGLHLLYKGCHRRHILGAEDPTWRGSRTTLLPKNTGSAVRRLRLVDVVQHPHPRPLGSPPPQLFSRRAGVDVVLGLIDKGCGIPQSGTGPIPGRGRLRFPASTVPPMKST